MSLSIIQRGKRPVHDSDSDDESQSATTPSSRDSSETAMDPDVEMEDPQEPRRPLPTREDLLNRYLTFSHTSRASTSPPPTDDLALGNISSDWFVCYMRPPNHFVEAFRAIYGINHEDFDAFLEKPCILLRKHEGHWWDPYCDDCTLEWNIRTILEMRGSVKLSKIWCQCPTRQNKAIRVIDTLIPLMAEVFVRPRKNVRVRERPHNHRFELYKQMQKMVHVGDWIKENDPRLWGLEYVRNLLYCINPPDLWLGFLHHYAQDPNAEDVYLELRHELIEERKYYDALRQEAKEKEARRREAEELEACRLEEEMEARHLEEKAEARRLIIQEREARLQGGDMESRRAKAEQTESRRLEAEEMEARRAEAEVSDSEVKRRDTANMADELRDGKPAQTAP
ncbi:hypothetical protein K402DRAFT_416897 [Aulographum hederae CBS 113979]|uniref:Uncharacterized protein n=1 Tax=Aulographum hederae CBS 113979 TaxID=1176131 RepID=A0A6G1HEL0_9PEZI|nr:hypothetical protein K402DRAFT_416897 [Aulographum hederae CBS 113979]